MSNRVTMMEMEKCPGCGADVRFKDSFCWNCGRPLREQEPLPHLGQTQNPCSARLVVMNSAGEVIQEYPLDKADVVIGRAPISDILLSKDKQTSRHHAVVTCVGGQYMICDERSANGTLVNGKRLVKRVPSVLFDGDRIGIGELLLVFHV